MPPEFSGKWRTECLNTRFPVPTVLCAGYILKLIAAVDARYMIKYIIGGIVLEPKPMFTFRFCLIVSAFVHTNIRNSLTYLSGIFIIEASRSAVIQACKRDRL